MYDMTPETSRQTYKLLQPHHTYVWKTALTVMRFEQLLRNPPTAIKETHPRNTPQNQNTCHHATRNPIETQQEKIGAFEKQLESDWRTHVQDVRTRGKSRVARGKSGGASGGKGGCKSGGKGGCKSGGKGGGKSGDTSGGKGGW